jgi:hypothetical protein
MREILDYIVNEEIKFIIWLQRARKWVFPSYVALFFHYLIKEEVIVSLL